MAVGFISFGGCHTLNRARVCLSKIKNYLKSCLFNYMYPVYILLGICVIFIITVIGHTINIQKVLPIGCLAGFKFEVGVCLFLNFCFIRALYIVT